MTDGIYIISVQSGYYPFVLVGWVRVKGLELEVYHARVLRYFGSNNSLSQLAEKGPMTGTQLLPPSEMEEVWRPNVSRSLPANEKAWAKDCPKPKGWGG